MDTKNPEKYSYIQECLENSVQKSIPECVGVSACGSGRTDAGTHASGQVAHFVVRYPKTGDGQSTLAARAAWTRDAWTEHCDAMAARMNLNLPRSVRVLHLFAYPHHFPDLVPFFHARKSAQSKQYSYYIQQGPAFMADWSPFCWYVKENLDIEMLKRELATIKGTHDFRNFVNDNKNPPGNTVLTIHSIHIDLLFRIHPSFPTCHLLPTPCCNPDQAPAYLPLHKPPLRAAGAPPFVLRIRIVGSGFLRHMVRRIVGTLQWIALGKLTEGVFLRVLNDGLDADINTTTHDVMEKEKDKETLKEVNINTTKADGMEKEKDIKESEQEPERDIKKQKVENGLCNNNGNATQLDNTTHTTQNNTKDISQAPSHLDNQNNKMENMNVNENLEADKNQEIKGDSKPRKKRNTHRLNKTPKRERKAFLGPAAPAKGLWLEKVWYGDQWCLDPDSLPLQFSPFVDCSSSISI